MSCILEPRVFQVACSGDTPQFCHHGACTHYRTNARDMYGNGHSQGTYVLLEIPSMHKLVQYFQSLYTCRNEDIYELKGVHIANF